jgi:hypothetical protein
MRKSRLIKERKAMLDRLGEFMDSNNKLTMYIDALKEIEMLRSRPNSAIQSDVEDKNKLIQQQKETIEYLRFQLGAQTLKRVHVLFMKGGIKPAVLRNWKGGRILSEMGYVQVYAPSHDRANGPYVPEHILVAEQMLGRSLHPGEVVHHKDGVKTNNVPSNLQVMTQSEHMKLHHVERRSKKYGALKRNA